MTAKEQIEALKDEIAELRQQMSAMAVAMAELAAKQPVQYVPYYVPPSQPNWWPRPSLPWATYSTGTDTNTGTALS